MGAPEEESEKKEKREILRAQSLRKRLTRRRKRERGVAVKFLKKKIHRAAKKAKPVIKYAQRKGAVAERKKTR